MAEPRIKTTIEFDPDTYERLADYSDSHDVGLARGIGLLLDGIEPGKRFKPPTLDEVRTHCKEKGYTFDPEAFHAFYESKGWRIGKEPMRKWKAACVTWQKRVKRETGATPETVEAFNRTMVGKNAKDYLDAYRAKFGCDPEGI
jgi:hypothetical protein